MDTKAGAKREGGGGGGSGRGTAIGLMDQPDGKPERARMIPVWFFIGVILFIYGILILATGIWEFSSPPPTVLANLHAEIWWGALLTLVGIIYAVRFYPRKS